MGTAVALVIVRDSSRVPVHGRVPVGIERAKKNERDKVSLVRVVLRGRNLQGSRRIVSILVAISLCFSVVIATKDTSRIGERRSGREKKDDDEGKKGGESAMIATPLLAREH